MGEPARRRATWADLLRTPEGGATYEIIGGEMEALPRPSPAHGHTQALLAAALVGPFGRGRGGLGGWWLIIEPDVMLAPTDIVAPDLVGWRRERVPEFPAAPPITVVPDWVCELLSPSNRRRDRIQKADLYLRAGVPHYWIVDVEERTLEAYEAREGGWLRLRAWTDGDTPRIPPFGAVEMEVGGLFPPAKGQDP